MKFSTDLPKEAVFGIFYNTLKDKFPEVTKLPVLQIPDEIREHDPNFKFKPLYKMVNEEVTLQIGHDVFAIHSPPDYIGWKRFSEIVFNLFEKIEQTRVFDAPISLVIRYLNFFEIDIFEHINLEIRLKDSVFNSSNTIFRTEIQENGFLKVLQVANNATLGTSDTSRKGSVLDISTVVINPTDFFKNANTITTTAHELEKELFFSLLKPDFLTTLNPEYDN